MKLVLASSGFATDAIANQTAELVGKTRAHVNLAVINEAYAVSHGDHSWLLGDLERTRRCFGGNMELVNLLALDAATVRQRVGQADVIYMLGGDTDYLMSVLRRTHFDDTLHHLLPTKVYVGSSAGSMILGHRVSTKGYQETYGTGDDYGTSDYLGVVDFAIKPHFNNPWLPQNRPEILLRTTAGHDGIVYGIPDDGAIIIDGHDRYTIGTPPYKVRDGQTAELGHAPRRGVGAL